VNKQGKPSVVGKVGEKELPHKLREGVKQGFSSCREGQTQTITFSKRLDVKKKKTKKKPKDGFGVWRKAEKKKKVTMN